ncbi:MFS transporter [Sinomonas flava]|uniref:MFS transporter n=1 Tax=Sinomonas flava TaxID=496857 RepID=UPI0039A5D3F7
MPRTSARVPVPRDVWVMVAAAFVIAVGFGLVSPVLPQLATSFGVGATAASVIVSAFALARLTLAPAAGSLVDRLGERPVYVTGLLLVAASSAACAFAPDYWTLLAVRGLGGIGSTMFTISASGLIVRLAPPDARGRVSGLYASSFLLGSITGPVLGGLLAGFGLRVPFLAYAAALVVAAAVVHLLLGRGGTARTTARARRRRCCSPRRWGSPRTGPPSARTSPTGGRPSASAWRSCRSSSRPHSAPAPRRRASRSRSSPSARPRRSPSRDA